VLIAWNAVGCFGLFFQVAKKILGGVRIQAVVFDKLRECDRTRQMCKLAFHLANLSAKLGGAARGVSVPEGHLAGFAGCGGNSDAIMRDLFDSPGTGAENNGVSRAALEHHFFIQLSYPRAFGGAGEEYAVESAV